MIDLLLAVTLHGGLHQQKSLGVIGIKVGLSGKSVLEVHPNTPAAGAGLLKGDKIVKSVDLEGRHDIDGRPYTPVALIVKRDGASPMVFIIERLPHQKISNPSVRKFFKGREDFVIGDDD